MAHVNVAEQWWESGMRVLGIVQSLCVSLMLCELALANNNAFLPGDAFFPTRLTEEGLGQLKADKNGPIFDYSSLGGYEAAFCGHAGYWRARFTRIDQAFINNLKRAYRHVRQTHEAKTLRETVANGKKSLVETNGIGVLFYPTEFEFPKYKLGLQYNENWVDEVERFGHLNHLMRLCCLVDTSEAVMESWRDSTVVAALKAELPDVELKPVPEMREPVIVRARVKAFVVDSRPLVKYFDPPKDGYEDVSVLNVDSSGISEITYVDGKWKQEEVESK
jgi:hypothetical protein